MDDIEQIEQIEQRLITPFITKVLIAVVILAVSLFFLFRSRGSIVDETNAPTTDIVTTIAVTNSNTTSDPSNANDENTVVGNETISATVTSNVSGLPGEFEIEVEGVTPSISKMPADQFSMPAPTGSIFVSDVYLVARGNREVEGKTTARIPSSVVDRTAIDMIGYDGKRWQFIPTELRGNLMLATLSELPQAVAIVEVNKAETPIMTLAAESTFSQPLPATMRNMFTEITAGTLAPQSDGSIDGAFFIADTTMRTNYLRLSNQSLVTDSTTILNFMINPTVRAAHITAIVEETMARSFDGVHIDYLNLTDDLRTNYTDFLNELQTALTAEKLKLAVTLSYPQLVGGLWDSGGEDWAAIGQIVDTVYVQMPLDPTLYTDNGVAEQFLTWAIRQADRRDMMLLYTANAVTGRDNNYHEISNEEAITYFGELELTRGNAAINNINQLAVQLSGTADNLAWDGIGATYKFTHQVENEAHTVWLGNEGSLAYRMRLAKQFGVRGILVRGIEAATSTSGYITALESANGFVEPPSASAAAILWSVSNKEGDIVASQTGGDRQYVWQTEDKEGSFVIMADFILGEDTLPIDQLEMTVVDPATAIPTPTIVPTATPEPVIGTIRTRTRLRRNPGAQSFIIAVLSPDEQFEFLDVDSSGEWIQIQPEDNEMSGWIFASLVELELPTEVEPPISTFETVATGTLRSVAALRLRPGSQYRLLGELAADTPVLVAAIDTNGEWLLIRSGDANQVVDPGWVSAELVRVSADFNLSSLPIQE